MVDLQRKETNKSNSCSTVFRRKHAKRSHVSCLRKERRKISLPMGKRGVPTWVVSCTTFTDTGAMLCTIPREINNAG